MSFQINDITQGDRKFSQLDMIEHCDEKIIAKTLFEGTRLECEKKLVEIKESNGIK